MKEIGKKTQSLEGEIRQYYENGALKGISEYQNGKLHGKVSHYEKNGNLSQESYYVNGVLHGISKSYLNGKLQLQTTYVMGKKHGESILYGKNGKILQTSFFEHGLKNGEFLSYDPDTQEIRRKEIYVKDKKEGPASTFFPKSSGAIKQESYYQNDQLDGFQRTYYSDGDVMEIAEYKNGQLVADPVRFKKGGKVFKNNLGVKT